MTFKPERPCFKPEKVREEPPGRVNVTMGPGLSRQLHEAALQAGISPPEFIRQSVKFALDHMERDR